MSMSVFLPSLADMAAYFDASYAVMQLSVSLYLAAVALLQLAIGPLSDRYGRRPVMLGFVGVFCVASFGCIIAPTVEVFLACRMLQASVAAGIVLSRAIVRDIYPVNEAAARIGYVTMGMALVPMVAPMFGGALGYAFGWKASFWMLFLSGAGVAWLSWRDQGETAINTGATFREQVRDYPELLRSRRFWGYALAAAFTSSVFFCFLGGAPYLAREVYGLNPLWTGICFGAPPTGYAVGNFISARMSARVGINPLIVWGTTLISIAMGAAILLTLAGFDGPLTFFLFCTFIGLGNGMVVPNASAGQMSVRPALAGTASGLGGTLMVGGGAAMSVLAGYLLVGATTSLPLLALMLVAALCALACMLYVLWRERQLELA